MLTGIPHKQRWWLWAFGVWIIFALGPGLLLANKPIFIGYFPLLYVYSITFWIISLVLCYILGYKLTFADVPEDLEPEEEK